MSDAHKFRIAIAALYGAIALAGGFAAVVGAALMFRAEGSLTDSFVIGLVVVCFPLLLGTLSYGLFAKRWWAVHLHSVFLLVWVFIIPAVIGMLGVRMWREKSVIELTGLVLVLSIPIVAEIVFYRRHRSLFDDRPRPLGLNRALRLSAAGFAVAPMVFGAGLVGTMTTASLLGEHRHLVAAISNDRFKVAVYQEGSSAITDGYTWGVVVDKNSLLKGERELFRRTFYVDTEIAFIDSTTVSFSFPPYDDSVVVDLIE